MSDLKSLLGKKKQESPEKKEAKLKALSDMRGIASDMMKDGLKGGLSKVTVAADNPEHLKEGLEKAKEILAKKELPGMEDESSEMESPEEESLEGEEMSPEEIDAEIERLMALKKAKC